MAKHETIFVRRRTNGKWHVVEIRIERKRKASIIDRLLRKHKLQTVK